eukprot:14737873-Alexandrium_andersonii.AAC.1
MVRHVPPEARHIGQTAPDDVLHEGFVVVSMKGCKDFVWHQSFLAYLDEYLLSEVPDGDAGHGRGNVGRCDLVNELL